MRRRAKAAQVQIPAVRLFGQIELFDALFEQIEAPLALGAADYLPKPGDEDVHGGDRLAVPVLFHVESLDFLWIIGDDDRPPDDLFRDEFFVFALEVAAPIGLELELRVRGLELPDGVGVGHVRKGSPRDLLERFAQAWLDTLVEEGDVLRTVFQRSRDEELDKFGGERDIFGKLHEGHLGFDHPEFGEVAGGVGVFRAERGPEGVYPRKGLAVSLDVELARDREIGSFAEEILLVIDGLAGFRERLEVEGRDLEHRARAFGVARGDDGRMDVVETALLKELVNCKGHAVAHAGDGAECVGTHPEVGKFPQEFKAVGLFLKGVAVGGSLTDKLDVLNRDFGLLAFCGR